MNQANNDNDTPDQPKGLMARQAEVLRAVTQAGHDGLTVGQVRDLDMVRHHGAASGTLSVLHRSGHLSRLTQTRDNLKVYVASDQVDGRATEEFGRRRPS